MTSPKVPAADQTLRILLLLAKSRGPLPASMIATQLGLPRSTVYHLLATLKEHGFVMHLPEEQRFGLGSAAIELSSAYGRQEPLTRLGMPVLASLTGDLGMSAHLAILHGTDVLYVVEQRAPGAPSLVTDIDVRLPAYLTATGRAILSEMPKAQVRALFPSKDAFVERPGRPLAISRYSDLRRVLDETKARGYSFEHEEITEGFSSVGFPVLDHRGWPIAGIAATFESRDLAPEAWPGVAARVAESARLLSSRMYGVSRNLGSAR